ncbi:hypothetical protein ABZ612_16330 [Streptomyces avermitilis]|uniref:hypothetical protein n=1 Tax=Streptomyces avermitilis TaxID=33903 RepID=UPI0033C7E25F
MNSVLQWAQTHSLHVAAVTAAVALMVPIVTVWARSRRRPDGRTPVAVRVASLAAMACTAYSADTSWRFAEHQLGMTSDAERAALFAAAELALFAVALMARQNLRGPQGAPGTPGLLVWVITGVQVIPAYSESGFVGGTVRAFVGPVLAAVLWHLAMGIELRHAKPGAGSQSLPAVIARELRERLLSRLGLATRDRTAEQITRDRATARAVQLAARPKLRRWGSSRLAAAVARSGVGTDPEQLDVMMRMLAARRGAGTLASVELRSPFELEPTEVVVEVERVPDVPEAYPAIEPAVPVVYPDPSNAVPAGAHRLPLMTSCGLPPRRPADAAPSPVPAVEVHAEPVPGPVPEWTVSGDYADKADDPTEPDPADDGYGDPLSEYGVGLAAEQFKEQLLKGDVPSIRAIKTKLNVGQARATEIQERFRQAQVAWRLAGSGAQS